MILRVMYAIHYEDNIHLSYIGYSLTGFVLYCNKKVEQVGYHATVIARSKTLLPMGTLDMQGHNVTPSKVAF